MLPPSQASYFSAGYCELACLNQIDINHIMDGNELANNYFIQLAHESKKNLKNALHSDTVNRGKIFFYFQPICACKKEGSKIITREEK